MNLDALGHFGGGVLSGVTCGLLSFPLSFYIPEWRHQARSGRIGAGAAYLLASQVAIRTGTQRDSTRRGFNSGIVFSILGPSTVLFGLNFFSGMMDKDPNTFPLSCKAFVLGSLRHAAILSPFLAYRYWSHSHSKQIDN